MNQINEDGENLRSFSAPLRIAINAQLSGDGVAGGVEQAVAGLVSGLGRLIDGNEVYLIVCAPGRRAWLEPHLGPNSTLIERPLPPIDRTVISAANLPAIQPLLPAARYLWRNTALRYREWSSRHRSSMDDGLEPGTGVFDQLRADVVNFPYQYMERVNAPSVFTPWDFQHEHHREFFTPEALTQRRLHYSAACRRATLIVVGAPSVQHDVCAFTGVSREKVFLIPWGNPSELVPTPSDDTLRATANRLRLPTGFALYPAKTFRHKNHIRLLQALARLRDTRGLIVPLVCCGGQDDYFLEIQKEVCRLDLEDQVRFVGFVDASDVRALYELAEFVVFPSLFEGWGFPPVEALSVGVPLACSAIQPLAERVGDAALLFDPTSVESIASAVETLATDQRLRSELCEHGLEFGKQYSWEVCARYHRALYRFLGGAELSDDDNVLLAKAQATGNSFEASSGSGRRPPILYGVAE
jgi:glycosyltransferase involved in cell wall biosynthesis